MQLGKALVGGIIGGALGVAALIAVQWFTGFDKAWLAILVALLTGIGVRSMVSTHGHASYLRGALTAVLALAAFAGGTYAYSEIAKNRAVSVKAPVAPPVEAPAEEGKTAKEGQEEAPVEPVVAKPVEVAPAGGNMVGKVRPAQELSVGDLVWLTIAGLVAYELGRGTSAPAVPQQEVIPPPDAT